MVARPEEPGSTPAGVPERQACIFHAGRIPRTRAITSKAGVLRPASSMQMIPSLMRRPVPLLLPAAVLRHAPARGTSRIRPPGCVRRRQKVSQMAEAFTASPVRTEILAADGFSRKATATSTPSRRRGIEQRPPGPPPWPPAHRAEPGEITTVAQRSSKRTPGYP